MKRFNMFTILIGILVVVCILTSSAIATSWKSLEPKEVINKADIVVEGEYIIQENYSPRLKEDIWYPFDFVVDKYYKGTGKKIIDAAIEQNDIGGVKEFQANGGKFVLFLEKREFDFWIPVAGPNGMLQIEKGSIKHYKADNIKVYKNYLEKQEVKEIKKPNSNQLNKKDSNNKTTSYLLIGFGTVSILSLGIYFIRRKV
jgi:hypothetical protein